MTDILKELDELLATAPDPMNDEIDFVGEIEEFDASAGELLRNNAQQFRAALELRARMVDVGWVLMPREPNDAILKAMEKQWSVGSSIDMARREYIAAITQENEDGS